MPKLTWKSLNFQAYFTRGVRLKGVWWHHTLAIMLPPGAVLIGGVPFFPHQMATQAAAAWSAHAGLGGGITIVEEKDQMYWVSILPQRPDRFHKRARSMPISFSINCEVPAFSFKKRMICFFSEMCGMNWGQSGIKDLLLNFLGLRSSYYYFLFLSNQFKLSLACTQRGNSSQFGTHVCTHHC